MDWNDPDELRRLRDLLGADPAAVGDDRRARTARSPTRSRCSSGGSGCPTSGGSYFTFSNENNDLIWGFLAECHRRGWLYKGHDTMPWCARCGTGLSQTEMNEGYQDREDPGLTVRFPLLDRPGEALLVWTTTPWTLTSNVAAAVGPDLRYVRVRQGDGPFWLAQGHAQDRARGAVRGPRGASPGADLVGWRYDGPVRRPAGRPRRRSRPARATSPATPYEHRVVAWDEVGEDEGTGIVHIAPGCGAEDFQLGKSLGLPVIAPLDECGHLRRRVRVADRAATSATSPSRSSSTSSARAGSTASRPITHRYPHCWRCGTPLVFRLVDEWYISMGPLYDQPRETLTAGAGRRQPALPDHGRRRPDPLDPGLRLRARARLAPQHARLDDQQEALLGPGAADLRLRGVRDGRGHRRSRRSSSERAVEGWEAFEGHTPHRPYVDAVTHRLPGCGAPVERIKDVGNPWLDAGIVPFSTLHFREDPDYWAAVVPGRLHHRELPRPVPQLVLLDARDVAPSSAASRRSRRSSATPSSSARTAGRCTRAGATRSTSTRPPSGWASTSCAGCSPRPGPRRTSCSAGTPPTRRAASCWSCGTSTRSS